jgi:hypothetical protein
MEMSAQINEIAAALSKAQGQMKPAIKDGKNPFYAKSGNGGAFATLESVINAIREPLATNGLCFVQGTDLSGDTYTVRTVIIHSSGQWIASSLSALPTKADIHGVGSIVSYLKRYGLQALVGLATIDDDGEAALGRAAPKETKTEAKAEAKKESLVFDKDNPGHREKVAKALGSMKVESSLYQSIYSILDGVDLTRAALTDAAQEAQLQNEIKL